MTDNFVLVSGLSASHPGMFDCVPVGESESSVTRKCPSGDDNNRKSGTIYRIVTFSRTLSDLRTSLKVLPTFSWTISRKIQHMYELQRSDRATMSTVVFDQKDF